MKYVKMLALAAVAAGALMAFVGAGTASATEICSTTANPCPAGQAWATGTVIDFSGSNLLLTDTNHNEIVNCTGGTVKGSLTSANTGPVETLTWSGCNLPVSTVKKGKLEIQRIAGTSNGTVVADGTFEVTVNTVIFGSCIYGVTSGVSLGDVTEGNPAVFHANAVAEEFTNNGFCPNTAFWTGTYTLTSPSTTASISG